MQLKDFQSDVLEKLNQYLNILEKAYQEEKVLVDHYKKKDQKRNFTGFCKKTWEKLDENGQIPISRDKRDHIQKLPYLPKKDELGNSIPNICLKIPTGGGKTLIGVNAVESINDYFKKNTGLILWIVPTEAIYRQTIKSFKDKIHPYRHTLERASGGRLKILEKTSSFSDQDIKEHLCIMLLMLQSANRETKESLRVFKDSGHFINFFPQSDNYKANNELLSQIKNLDFHGNPSQNFGGVKNISIKHSLGNALRIVRPIIVLDEGHKAYSPLARNTITDLNPRFILELSATPNMREHQSNVLINVSGVRLKEEEMIKIPINILNSQRGDWKKTLCQAYEKQRELENQAQEYFKNSYCYIRPIVLIQVERTGRDQRGDKFIHSEDAKEYLVNHLGISPDAIRIKTSGRNELKDEDLLSDTSSVKYIITNKALQEGWDCPFAYILAILGNSQSKQALTQLIGRVLRQPYAKEIKSFPDLNESHVFCYNKTVKDVVEDIKKGLQREGMDDVVDHIKYDDSSFQKEPIKRRKGFEKTKVFLPRVLYKDKNSWRNIIYESDLLQNIDYSKISYSEKDNLSIDSIESSKTGMIKVDIEEDGLYEIERQYNEQDTSIDFSLMTKRLCNFIPNPIEAGRILDEVILSLKSKGMSEEKIYLNRHLLLNEIERDIRDQVDKLSEDLFKNKLKNGKICFKIFKDHIDINWTLGTKVDFIVSATNKVLKKRDDSPLQLSLFEKTYERDYNTLEKKVAWYLDEKKAIKWWHRMISKQDYYLQGWQKRKVWPDFLAYCVSESQISAKKSKSKYIILETKGDHLKGNDDTNYKDKLFHILEKHYCQKPIIVGEFETATSSEQKMIFKILMEGSWEKDLQRLIDVNES